MGVKSGAQARVLGQMAGDVAQAAGTTGRQEGTRQPLTLDAIDLIQGNAAPGVTMHPDHIAGLKALDAGRSNGLENETGGHER